MDNVLKNSEYVAIGLNFDWSKEESMPEVCEIVSINSTLHWLFWSSSWIFAEFKLNWCWATSIVFWVFTQSTICFVTRTEINSSTVPNTKNRDIKRYQPSKFSLDPVGLSDYKKKNEGKYALNSGNTVYILNNYMLKSTSPCLVTYHFIYAHVCKG